MPHVPGAFDGATGSIAALALLVEFAMLRVALLRAQVRLYAFQSLLVAVVAGFVAADRHMPALWALAAVTVVLKVFVVPAIVTRLLRGSPDEISGSGVLGVATEVLVAIVVGAFGFFAVGSMHFHSSVLPVGALALAVAVVLVSFVLMAARRDVVSQAIGFFSLENGVSLASLVVAAAMPLLLGVALLLDLIVAVVAFSIIMRLHEGRADTLLTTSLTRLRG